MRNSPEPCGCNCVTIRDVSVSDHDLFFAVSLMGATKLSRETSEDKRTLVQTDRYQRRELTRNGIPYKEID